MHRLPNSWWIPAGLTAVVHFPKCFAGVQGLYYEAGSTRYFSCAFA